ncbi:MAG: ATP-dependent zinc metalloprotease FtsH [Bacillota bacterium]
MILWYVSNESQAEKVDINTFEKVVKSNLNEGRYVEVHTYQTGQAEARIKRARTDKIFIKTYKTSYPSGDKAFDVFQKMMPKAGPNFKYQAESQSSGFWPQLLVSLIPMALIVAVFFIFFNQMQSSGNKALSFGKSRAKLHNEHRSRVTFDDVAGVDEAKQELQEIVDYLRQPKRFTELGARIPKGILLVGSPGTGKTLLARAVAGEAGVPFFSISGSDFVEMFVGVGASRVRDLFEQAKRNVPCIIFIDELDAVGRQRGTGLGGGHDEREQTLNQLLSEMDGFETNNGIIVLAATNRPDVLDPALLRPGRFDRQIVVDIPDQKGREAILKIHAKNKPLAEEVDLNVLARRTTGFTGADLENLLNEAALLAARLNKKQIGMDELEEAINRIVAGPEKKNRLISDREKDIVAYHEAGHAVVGYFLPHCDPIHRVSVIPRGRAGGYTLALPKEDRHYMTRSELADEITMILGGRAAESAVLGDITTGAHNDLDRATKLAHKMVTEYGMSDELGPMTFGRKQEDLVFLGRDLAKDKDYSEQVAASIDREIRKIIDDSYDRAQRIIVQKKGKLEDLVKVLKEQETIEGDQISAVLGPKDEEKKVG